MTSSKTRNVTVIQNYVGLKAHCVSQKKLLYIVKGAPKWQTRTIFVSATNIDHFSKYIHFLQHQTSYLHIDN